MTTKPSPVIGAIASHTEMKATTGALFAQLKCESLEWDIQQSPLTRRTGRAFSKISCFRSHPHGRHYSLVVAFYSSSVHEP